MHSSLPVTRAFGFTNKLLGHLAAPVAFLLLLFAPPLGAQSTFGTILGTAHDVSGAVIPGATVTLVNSGTSAQRIETSDGSGNFVFSNIDVGNYTITISATGFETFVQSNIGIIARESRRIEAALQLGAQNETVTVVAQQENVITTDVSNLAVTKTGDELVELPVAIYSRSTGSTSPISTLTTEAGVQTDDSGALEVMGATAALLSVTVDGISSVGVEYSGPVNEMFPSFNSIEEIRVSESNNNAEFSGVADITTISKAGSNKYHGGVFENHENTVFNAGNPFTNSKPKIIMNDFGGTMGGPLTIPHLYQGRDRTFFFTSYEGLRLPRETPILTSVPSLAMRSGNLTNYLSQQGVSAIYYPDGTQITDTSAVPINPISANMMTYLMPKPNFGPADSYSFNYQANFPSPISTNQGDVRLDQTINSKQSMFGRFSYKNRQVSSAPNYACTFNFCQTAGSPLQGAYNTPEIDEGMTFAYNYIITPKILNEFRGGFNAQHTSTNQGYSTTGLLSQIGLTAITQPDTEWSEAPQVLINGFMATGAGNPTRQRGQIVQVLDNLTWTASKHTFKFGADFKRLTDHDDNVFGNYRDGWYVFDGSSTVTAAIGDPFAEFLLGYPDYTVNGTVNKQTMDGLGYAYAFFGQDDWKITPNLTLNLGLRYELHPPLKETNYNTAFFLPDWSGPAVDGSTAYGAVAVPNQQALSFESGDFEQSIYPTPTLTAQQAGIPSTLRYTGKTDWGPRLGFAWRPYGHDKTVLRGGWGRFIETPLGFSLVSGWAVDASYVGYYYQPSTYAGDSSLLSLQNPFQGGIPVGSAGFYYAFPVHYIDPSVQQWNLTFEQDLGHGVGMRLSYTGSHGKNLEVFEDLNQVPANAIGYNNPVNTTPSHSTASCISDNGTSAPYLESDLRPFPCFAVLQSIVNQGENNYNSATVDVARHSGKGITFDASYMFTRDLSNANGATPSAFAALSSGNNWLTDRFHPGRDYGNVVYDRKHRFLATYLYDLPFGSGQRWLNTASPLAHFISDWQLGGVTILQSGPFLTPFQQSVDPANTNILATEGQTRTDQLTNISLYAPHRTTGQWLNAAAFPYLNLQNSNGVGIGRFANAPVGGIVGPGTANFSLSLMKGITLHEQTKLQLSIEASNVFNHRNYEPPNTQVDAATFGQISGLQTAEGAGPRSLELAGRITF
jgi:Carboxypeptidase regulatory-like domain